MRAPVNGFITNLNLANGTYASQGKPVMALIDSDSYRVERVFRGNQDPAHQTRRQRGDLPHGRIACAARNGFVGIARGITDQDNKDGPQLLSSVNPTFTWVRLAQRIPVTRPPHARATRRVGQRRNDLHRRDEGRRGASNRARHQESHGGNFWSAFGLVRDPSLSRATCALLANRTVRAHHAPWPCAEP